MQWERLVISKKIRDTKGIFHAKVGTIKDSMDQSRRYYDKVAEYTEELYKKGLNDPDNHSSEVTHLKPDILESKVKRSLGNLTANEANGHDGIWSLVPLPFLNSAYMSESSWSMYC